VAYLPFCSCLLSNHCSAIYARISKFSKHKEIKGKKYARYDNYNAIEVPFADAIPNDYNGVMGVPISFLDKYSPEQFEILGLSRYTKTKGMSKEFVDAYYKSGQTGQISEGHPDLCYYDNITDQLFLI
jgi:hypothetical protein